MSLSRTMQVEEIEGYKKRFQYYAAKAYAEQIERGEEYVKLNQVIFIGILDFSAFESKHYLSRHLLLNLETKDQELNDIEFNFIELSKFKKKEQELTTLLDKWIYFIKHADRLDVIPENTNSPALKSAYDVAERFHWSKEELEIYDYWSMKLQDERGALAVAERCGVEAGRKEGEKAARLASARSMLADGLEATLVAKYTGLSLEEVVQL